MPPPRKERKKYNRNNFHRNAPPRKTEYKHKDQLTESEVGITEFVSKLDGFAGIIKARFSDFHVNEIDLDGNVVKLTDTSYPKDFSTKLVKYNYKEVDKSPCTQIPQEIWEALIKLASDESSEAAYLDVEHTTKEDRKEIYECVRSYFGRRIVASTKKSEEDENKKQMVFTRLNKDDQIDNRRDWPEDKGDYVYFVLYKKSMDTVEASLRISNCLKMNTSMITYAGVKDKRGITTQWFCVKRVEPAKIINRTKDQWKIKVGNFKFKDTPLRLGDLKGNFFKIALRNVDGSDEIIEQAMNHIKGNGFINYYGLQRFGNDKEVPTFQIGIKLLLGKWKEAIDLILKPKSSDDLNSDDGDLVLAKQTYAETGNAAEALAKLDRSQNRCIEAKLLQGMVANAETDYVNALEKIPRSMRLFYMHSFQSLIWNKMVSKRLQLFGLKPVEGDFVLVTPEDTSSLALEVDENEELEEVTSESSDEKSKKTISRQNVKTLTPEDLPHYSIYDVVLPMPGYDVIYPENMKEHYKEAVEELGLTLEMPQQTVRTYSLCGNYRKLLVKIEDITWKIMYYNNPTDDLIRSDFDELKGEPEKKSVENGNYKALVMQFSLPPSCYATMVLREIMKINTSTSSHAKLNDYHEVNQNKKKILIENGNEDKMETSEEVAEVCSSSLLSNPAMFEEFQKSIFTTETSTKRKNEDNDTCHKKVKVDNATEKEDE